MKKSTFINQPCPLLPKVNQSLPITHTRKFRPACDSSYFLACLHLAQSLWRSGSPAQAILQLDKSMMASSTEEPLDYPYAAILWIINNAPSDQFLGNPVRHFQHLASRMNHSQPNAQTRVWRAWTCLHLTEQLIPEATNIYPRDNSQIEKESLIIPTMKDTLLQLQKHGSNQETTLIRTLLES